MKKRQIAYIILFLVICLIPSLGLVAGGPEESLENRSMAEKPSLRREDGSFNRAFLSDAGAWFEDHFAFRNELVTAYAGVLRDVFRVSAQDSVIVGEDGWLYYRDSLADYQGADLLSDRQLFSIAHTLKMIQDYAEEQGTQFLFAVAPNKNTLYGEHMPYYYRAYRGKENNLDRLSVWLASENVNTIDLKSSLASQQEVLYHKSDSHWDNLGAALAADQILGALGIEHIGWRDREYEVREDFDGDLAKMLVPAAVRPEAEYHFKPEPDFLYTEPVESNFDPLIETEGEGPGYSLLMYRDSFGSALLPFMAEAFSYACFSRGVPYDLGDLEYYEADVLVIEKAERFLRSMLKDPPLMEAPEARTDAAFAELEEAPVIQDEGVCFSVSGRVPEEDLDPDDRIFIRINGERIFEAFPCCGEDGSERFFLATYEELTEDDIFEIALSRT